MSNRRIGRVVVGMHFLVFKRFVWEFHKQRALFRSKRVDTKKVFEKLRNANCFGAH